MLEKSLGKEHAEVAEVLNSMGLVLKKRADYEGAEALYLAPSPQILSFYLHS